MRAFDSAFQYLLQNEGTRFVDNPNDPGGATKFGITLRILERRLDRVIEKSDVENLTEDVASRIYFDDYWLPLGCDKMTSQEIATCIFDTAVLYGPVPAAQMAQKTANNYGAQLKIDGVLGPESLAAINMVSPEDFIVTFCNLVLKRVDAVISAHPNEEVFENGWVNRAKRLLTLIKSVPVIEV
jgi:lysozyme family protein